MEPAAPVMVARTAVTTLRRVVAAMLAAVLLLALSGRAYDQSHPADSRLPVGPQSPQPVAPGGGGPSAPAVPVARSMPEDASGVSRQPGHEGRPFGRFGAVWELLTSAGGRGAPSAPSAPPEATSGAAAASKPVGGVSSGGVSSLQRWVERSIAPQVEMEVKLLLTGEQPKGRPRPPPPGPSHPPRPPSPHQGLLGYLDCDCSFTADYACPGTDAGGKGWARHDGSICFDWCCCT